MTRLRGRRPKGQRLLSKVPFGHWKTQTFIAASSRLTSKPNWSRPSKPKTSSSATICLLTKARPPRRPFAPRALGSCSCRPIARPQSNRDRFRQAQGPAARQGDQKNRRPLARHRRNLRPLQSTRMRKLLQNRRIWIQMSVRCARLPVAADEKLRVTMP